MGHRPAVLAAHVAQPVVLVYAVVHAAVLAPPVAYAPVGHAPVTAVRPVVAQYLPAVHGRQVTCPVAALKVPVGQSVRTADVVKPEQ